jgi:Uncharacterized protein conserved in bacteria (DUF2188)
MAKTDVYVVHHEDRWAVKRPEADRSSGVFDTQAEAIHFANQMEHVGTVHIQGRHGSFRPETPWDE